MIEIDNAINLHEIQPNDIDTLPRWFIACMVNTFDTSMDIWAFLSGI